METVSGVDVGEDGLCPCQHPSPLPCEEVGRSRLTSSGGHGDGNQCKNRTQDGFSLPSASPKRKKYFCRFLFILFSSWQKWSFLYLFEIHKARFLVKSATGGRESNIA